MATRTLRATRMVELRREFWRDMREARAGFMPKRVRDTTKTRTGGRQQPTRPATQNEYPADVRMAFVDWVDAQARAGAITDSLADRATL
ncbi:hypothetical protein UFOVP703_33 [uncultured Caudovirales phage]|uniref:Uncharacterized protein n=1 Tax=uncultured Caudovirales phage TaxID=2100421 RepID=A0A6J5NN22_9CAUD|nr:hypothetical protein UFOVP703_33 [uncultured Caudovirales phage]